RLIHPQLTLHRHARQPHLRTHPPPTRRHPLANQHPLHLISHPHVIGRHQTPPQRRTRHPQLIRPPQLPHRNRHAHDDPPSRSGAASPLALERGPALR